MLIIGYMGTSVEQGSKNDGGTDLSEQEMLPCSENLLLPQDVFQMVDKENPDLTVLSDIYTILNHPKNKHRFANPPENMARMLDIATTEKIHILTAQHPETQQTIGTLSIIDPHSPEHETWLGHIGISPEFQRKGVGRQLLEMGLFTAFTTNAYDGRLRERVYVGVTLNEGFEGMIKLAKYTGFRHVWKLPDQMGEQSEYESYAHLATNWSNEMKKRYDAERYMITMKEWARNTTEGMYETLNRFDISNKVQEELTSVSGEEYHT